MKMSRTKSFLNKSLGVAIVYGLFTISGGSSRAFAAPLDIVINPGIDNPLGIKIDPLGSPTAGINMNNHDIYNVKDIYAGTVIGTTLSTGVGGAKMTGTTVSTGLGGASMTNNTVSTGLGASMNGLTVSTGSGVNLITLDGSNGNISANTLQTSGMATLGSGQVDGALAVYGTTTLYDNLVLDGGDISTVDRGDDAALTLSAATAQLTNGDGHGLTVVNDGTPGILHNYTTLSGGTNTSTLTLTDGSATVNVAGTSGTARELISATTSPTSTNPAVRVGSTDSGNLTVNDDGVTLDNHGSPARLRGVANGVNDYDAVNVKQLNDVSRNAYSGIAQIAAMTAIPAPASGHRYAFGVGVGTYGGEQAIAAGAKGAVSDNILVAGSIGAGFSARTPVAGAVGASFSW